MVGPLAGTGAGQALDDEVRAELARALAQIRHGSITLVVQDGRVIQIDFTHKVRLRPGAPASEAASRLRRRQTGQPTRTTENGLTG